MDYISFCVKRNDLNDKEYDTIIRYSMQISHKHYEDEDIIEDIHMTYTYIFGTIDRNDSLYRYLSKIDVVEFNE
jgi:hypothetical protein